MKHYLLGLILIVSTMGCSTTPTGRKQLRYLPEGQMATMGDSAYQKMKREKPVLPRSSPEHQTVECISRNILQAIGQNPNAWEVAVFNDKSPNAFAVPGQNIGVHTGMIRLVKNIDQLAAVIGHEIGHVLAHHGNERASQGLLVQGGMVAAQIYLGRDSQTDNYILAALGIGAQFGVLLPFSRTHETEADELGLDYMAAAGFDPRQAAELWVVMGSLGNSPPEFMSTHPHPASRAENLRGRAQAFMGIYQRNRAKQNCRL